MASLSLHLHKHLLGGIWLRKRLPPANETLALVEGRVLKLPQETTHGSERINLERHAPLTCLFPPIFFHSEVPRFLSERPAKVCVWPQKTLLADMGKVPEKASLFVGVAGRCQRSFHTLPQRKSWTPPRVEAAPIYWIVHCLCDADEYSVEERNVFTRSLY